MYRKELNEHMKQWKILDPEGDYICQVETEEEADGLLSHLNRNSY